MEADATRYCSKNKNKVEQHQHVNFIFKRWKVINRLDQLTFTVDLVQCFTRCVILGCNVKLVLSMISFSMLQRLNNFFQNLPCKVQDSVKTFIVLLI